MWCASSSSGASIARGGLNAGGGGERVVADLVALGDGAAEDLLAALDRLAEHEEGAVPAVLPQQVEHVGRLRTRAVVERERNQPGGGRALRDDGHGCRARNVS